MDVVEPEWVDEHRDALALVDVREPWEYDGIGHVPGSVNVPFDDYRGDDGEAGKLPGAEAFADVMGAAGVSHEDDVVAYDDTHGVFAARLLVTCELYGHDTDRLHLLDGDLSAWRREYPVDSDAAEVEPATYEAAFVGVGTGALVGMDAVVDAMDDPDAVIVDTREEWEYDEGHIPGAVRLDWLELVDTDSRGLRDDEDLRALLDDRGITPDRHVVLYCNTARRISHTYVVLRHLGYGDLSFYEGSLTEWEADGRDLAAND